MAAFVIAGLAWLHLSKVIKKFMKEYRAIIWGKNENRPGQRVVVWAENLDEARRKLEAEYGEGTVFDLHNEEDANRPR